MSTVESKSLAADVTAFAARATPRLGRYRWVICGLLFTATLINYLDRQILGILKPDLARELHWSEMDYGQIAIAFQATYALGQACFGPLIEWLGTKSVYAGSIVFWSLAAIAHAFTRSVFGFTLVRGALGLGESGNFPTAIKTVAEWFPPKERSIATGIFNAGTNIGAIFSPLLVPWLATQLGWRSAFIALGATGFVWLGFWFIFYEVPARSSRVHADELAYIHTGVSSAAEQKISWRRLLGYREAWAYYATCVLVGPVWWFYGFWLPDFFHKQFHLDLKHFGPPLVIVYTVASLGSIAGGALSSALLRRGWTVNTARKAASLLCAFATLPVIFSTRVESVWLATGFFALAAAAHQGWSATMYTVVADIFPKRAVASVVGFGGTLASVVSMGFFWFVSHKLQGAGSYGTIMLLCGSAYVVAWTLFHVGVPRIKPVIVN